MDFLSTVSSQRFLIWSLWARSFYLCGKIMQSDLLVYNASQVCTVPAQNGGPQRPPGTLAIIEHGAVAVHQGKIVAVGSTASLQTEYTAKQIFDAQDCSVIP